MTKYFAGFLTISLILSAARNAPADCGQFSITLTNLPNSATSGYQVNGLNSAGQLTGFYYNEAVPAGHAFLYTAGNLLDAGALGGGFSEGLAINNSGWIAGQSQLNGDIVSHAILFNGATLLDLGSLSDSDSSGSAINNAGQVAGSFTLTDSSGTPTGTEAFLFSSGSLMPLGTLGGTYSVPSALNNAGVVVGQSSVTNGDIHGFVFANTALTDIGTLGGNYSAAFAVNDSGLVVGESTTTNNDNHAVVYSAGALTDIGTLGGTYSSAYLINSNQVAGLASTADAQFHGFLYSNGAMTDIGTLGGTYSGAYGMNNLGQIVGEAETSTGAIHAFLWDKGTMVDLNSLLPTNSSWELDRALFINDNGRIVGFGVHNGVFDWFILDLAGGNHAPQAIVTGASQPVDCQTQVTLDGTQSSDPDGDALTFQWISAGLVLGTNSTLQGYYVTGTNIVTLLVTDPCGASASTSVAVIVRDTTPPTISGPTNITVAASSGCDAAVPDLTSQVTVSDNCTPIQSLVLSQNPVAGTSVGLGRHCIIVTVKDLAGNVAAWRVVLKVVDTTAPVILAISGPITNSANGNCQGVVPNVLGSVIATDNCTAAGDLDKVQYPAAGTVLDKGQHTITVCVKDASGNRATRTVAFTIADTTAPVIQSVSASPNVLSPPNHQMVPVCVSVRALESCAGAPCNKIISITCNEATLPNEIVITGKLTAKLAATRNGAGRGRIYTITVQSTDNVGNSSTATTKVTVPQGNN